MNSLINLFTIALFLRLSCESMFNEKLYRSKRVFDGTTTVAHSNPWLGQLYYEEKFCGNVFLVSRPPYHHSHVERGSSDVVITAAKHFHVGMNAKNFKVSFGKHILGKVEENQVNMQLKRVILHPKSRQIGDVIDDGIIHAKQRAQHNIAMLKLDRQVHFTEFVKPIALANSPSLINCSFTGWEKEKEGWEYKEYLNSLNPKENEDYLDSLFDQLIHKKNITPQIKVGKPEIPIKEHEFNKRKMLTVDMSNVSSWNNILEITTPKKKHFTKGDYGAPLICNIAGQPYARGVSAVGFKLTELFTDIFVNMAWILEMYKTIDNERPFHTELDIYSGVKLTSRFVIRKHLEYTLKGAVGYVPFEFNRKYEDQKLEGSNFTEMWRNMLVENFVRIHHNKFCMYKIIGYKEMDNVYDCATWCLLQNGNRICNYLPSLSRCYLAHHGFVPRYCADMPAQQSVVIYIDTSVVDPYLLTYNAASAQVIMTGPKKPWKQLTWKVGISTSGWPNFHCLGYLTSEKNSSKYSKVTYSTECIKRLLLNASNMEKINVQANLGSRVVNIKIVKERKCDVDSMGFRHCPISKRTKPPGFPANFGHHEEKTSIPKLKRYSPWSGAFMSQPYSLKWITYFETNQKDVCIGVLVKEYDVTGNGTQDRTSSSLTTATCAKNINMMAGVRTSTYFLKCIAPHQKVYHVGKISIHPNFTTKDQNTNDVETSVEFNIAVIQLKESITFDRYIGSVEVLSNQSLTGSNLVVAAWNVSGGDPYGSLYEIPVQIIGNERIHIAKTLLTERPYQKDNGMLDQEVKAKPLIAYKQNGEATLIGLHVAMAGYKKKSLERYITLKQHIPWIKQELEMNIEPPKRATIKLGHDRF